MCGMLKQVEVATRHLAEYVYVVGEDVVEQISDLAAGFRGARVLHVNAAVYGGGVAEILHWLVPLMRGVGLEAEWQVIEGTDEFFRVTKSMHNGIQGMDLDLTAEMKALWERINEDNAQIGDGQYDYVIVHDPQPAGMLRFSGGEGGRNWIWRCHIDSSEPNPAFWEYLVPYVQPYDACVFTMEDYVGPGLDLERAAIIPPKIDPLSPKNLPCTDADQKAVLERFGVDPDRPLLCQVSRFDPWKDPVGVIDAYRIVKERCANVQLALVGSMATDDPEGWFYYDQTLRHAGTDADITVLHNFHGVDAMEVAAFQSAADVVIQKSIREGFGLVVAEALWKGVPVVGGNVGGIRLQIMDGETGYLVDSVEECAQRCCQLLEDEGLAQALGASGREHVRQHFLSVHHLRDYLNLFARLGE